LNAWTSLLTLLYTAKGSREGILGNQLDARWIADTSSGIVILGVKVTGIIAWNEVKSGDVLLTLAYESGGAIHFSYTKCFGELSLQELQCFRRN
jgi:hypothetical protein